MSSRVAPFAFGQCLGKLIWPKQMFRAEQYESGLLAVLSTASGSRGVSDRATGLQVLPG